MVRQGRFKQLVSPAVRFLALVYLDEHLACRQVVGSELDYGMEFPLRLLYEPPVIVYLPQQKPARDAVPVIFQPVYQNFNGLIHLPLLVEHLGEEDKSDRRGVLRQDFCVFFFERDELVFGRVVIAGHCRSDITSYSGSGSRKPPLGELNAGMTACAAPSRIAKIIT